MSETLEPAAVPELLRPRMTVALTGGLNEPRAITAALAAAPSASRGVNYLLLLLPGLPSVCPPGERLATFFMAPELEAARSEGRVDLLPMQYRDIYDYLEREAEVDLVLTQVSAVAPAGASDDELSLGLAVDFLPALLARRCPVVAELNRALPAPPGAPTVSRRRLSFTVESERPFPHHCDRLTPTAEAIGAHVAGLVEDGDCIQTGVGAIPGAVLAALSTKNDLGFHSGMLTDAAYDLLELGVLNGRRKSRDRGKAVSGFVLGGEELYAWAAAAPELLLRPVDYTHDLRVLAELDRFVAINSAVEVDLYGQVNAEMVRGRQISGTGGAVDFLRGAARSRGGRSIVALPSTAARGTVSRIVPALAHGTVATALRTDVDWVVTEHGAARLRGAPVEARAEALVAIAAPEFRDELRQGWREMRAADRVSVRPRRAP